MFFSSKSQIFAILFGGVLVVLLLFARTKPDVSAVEVGDNLQVEIEQAVQKIRDGQQPMEGIMALRKIAEEHPENEEAQLYLGIFSIQSGQYEKAVERFNNVLSINAENSYAYQLLGQAYELMNDTTKAISNYELFVQKTDDSEAKKDIEKHLKNLKL